MMRQVRGEPRGGLLGNVQSREETTLLMAQRDDLKEQLELLAERRGQLVRQLETGPDAAVRRDIESRLRDIDGRESRLDAQIASLNDRIMQGVSPGTPAPVIVDVPRVTVPEIRVPPFEFRGNRRPDLREIGGIMAAEAVLLALIGLAFWRVGMRRMRAQIDRLHTGQTQQLNQLQQAMDVIGVEVERISEGQRYVAKVLAEGSPAAAALSARKVPEPARDR